MDHRLAPDALIGGRRKAHIPWIGDYLVVGALLFHAYSPAFMVARRIDSLGMWSDMRQWR
jgi:hypothetical protein